MKTLVALLTLVVYLSPNIAKASVNHSNCQVVISLGADGRYIMNSRYELDMEGYAKVVVRALETKGYHVIATLNYDDVSAFGNEGLQKAKSRDALALEFRFAAPSYKDNGHEEHRCAGGVKMTDPKSQIVNSVTDANGALVGTFTTYPTMYQMELETRTSIWVPVRSQCQSIFNTLMRDLPTCRVAK